MNFDPFPPPDELSLSSPQDASFSSQTPIFEQAEGSTSGQTAEAISKRTLQNRKAQREFRARRQAYLRDLEDKVRRYEAGQTDQNSVLQQQVAQLRSENDQLRLQLAEMSRSHPAASPPLATQPGSSYRPTSSSSSNQSFSGPSSLRLDQHQQQLFYSDVRNAPLSPTFDAQPAHYPPISQDSLPALTSTHLLSRQQQQQPPQASRFSVPGPASMMDRQGSSRQATESSFGPMRSARGFDPQAPQFNHPTGPPRLPAFTELASNRQQLAATQTPTSQPTLSTALQPGLSSWSQVPNGWMFETQQQQQQQQQPQQNYPQHTYDRHGSR